MLIPIIATQVIVFGAVIYALKKIMLGNTESAVNRLQNSYQEVAKKKEEVTKKISQIEEECQKQRQALQEELKKAREEAEAELEGKKESTIKEARAKAEQLINDALGTKDKLKKDIEQQEQLKMVNYCEAIIKSTLSVLMRKKLNDSLVEEILEEIKNLDCRHISSEIKEVELVFAEKPDPDLISRLEKIISEKMNKEINFKHSVDQAVVAGIVVKFGSLVLDQSLANKVEAQALEMKKKVEDLP